jgi:hypothetical protein
MKTTTRWKSLAWPLIIATIGMLICVKAPVEAVLLGGTNATTGYKLDYGNPLSAWANDSQGAHLMDAYGTATASATTPGFGSALGKVEMLNSASPGIVGAKSDILGSIDLPENITNMSNAHADSNWIVSSSTLGAGEPVHLSLTAHFEGTLSAAWLEGTPGSVSAQASGDWEYGTGYFSYAGGGWGDVTLNPGGIYTTNQDWVGGVLDTTESPGVYIWTVDMPVDIHTKVGDSLRLRLNLQSACSAIGPAGGPYKAYALSDFYNTGYFTGIPLTGDTYLKRNDKVVPEPSSAAALGVMMAGMIPAYLRGRKRRS